MSIVSIKNHLALIITNALNVEGVAVKMIKSDFNEDSDNKPQMSRQIVVRFIDSIYTLKSVKDKSYSSLNKFQVEVTLKDLRSDDNIQSLVEIVARSLIGVSIEGKPIQSLTVSNQGFDNGIWKYDIDLEIVTSSDKDSDDDCLLSGVDDLTFNVIVSPSYSIPLRS